MEGNERLAWRETGKEELLRTPVFTVNRTTSVSPEGGEAHFIVNEAPDWAIVIAEDGGDFLMVRQWRHGENALSVEFPGGVVDAGEAPEDAARRELREETGFSAGELVPLGSMNPNPALFRNRVHFFAARSLCRAGGQELDADEFVSYFRVPKAEVVRRMGSAEYPHALMAAALSRWLVEMGGLRL